MKMKMEYSWNNSRHCAEYWVSLVMLLGVSLNIVSWFSIDKKLFIKKLGDIICGLYTRSFPSIVDERWGTDYILYTLITLYFLVLLNVWLVNHILGVLPNMRASENAHEYSYLLKTVVIGDIIIGIALEVCAIKGMIESIQVLGAMSIGVWPYSIMFIFGSYLYWDKTILLKKVKIAKNLFRSEKQYEKETFYCISNIRERVSTFTRAPRNGNIRHVFVDKEDVISMGNISENSFYYYLLLIDTSMRHEKAFDEEISKILSIPHANIVVLLFGEAVEYMSLIDKLNMHNNIHIRKYPTCKHCERVDIESLIGEIDYVNNNLKIHPMRFIKNKNLINIYFAMGHGPQICLAVLKKIMNELDIRSAIYTLFDFVDLQYRIQIALSLESDYERQCTWMRKNGRKIGNINEMAAVIKVTDEKADTISIEGLFERVFSENEKRMIYKYIPKLKSGHEKSIQDLAFITASLRNALRGHGSFEEKDSMDIYMLLFKLALLNVYSLNGNSVSLLSGDVIVGEDAEYHYYQVFGGCASSSLKVLSPFLVANKDGEVMVFNNWNKGMKNEPVRIEYINYLDGTIIHIEHKRSIYYNVAEILDYI